MRLIASYDSFTDPAGSFPKSLFDVFSGVLEGHRIAVLTEEGWLPHAGAEFTCATRVACFWWTGYRVGGMPVLVVIDRADTVEVYWEAPEEWPRRMVDRYMRDCERFHRELAKGESGRRLRRFRLGTEAMVFDFMRGSLSAYQAATH